MDSRVIGQLVSLEKKTKYIDGNSDFIAAKLFDG